MTECERIIISFAKKVESGTWHKSAIIEPDIPYELYKKEILGIKDK